MFPSEMNRCTLERPYLTHKSFNNSSSSVYAYFPHDTICPKCVSDKCNTPSPSPLPHDPLTQQTHCRVIFITLNTIHAAKVAAVLLYIYILCCLKDFGIYKNFLTLWLQTFFPPEKYSNHVIALFLSYKFDLYIKKKIQLEYRQISYRYIYSHLYIYPPVYIFRNENYCENIYALQIFGWINMIHDRLQIYINFTLKCMMWIQYFKFV